MFFQVFKINRTRHTRLANGELGLGAVCDLLGLDQE